MQMPESTNPLPMSGWWTTPSAAWPEVSEHAYEVWCHRERAKAKLEPADARSALAFGFTGRLVYGERRAWPELVGQFELDWSAAGLAPPWERARAAVKEGWTFALVAGNAQEEARNRAREVQAVGHAASTEQPVPGGRMSGI